MKKVIIPGSNISIQAENILQNAQADMIMIALEMLHDPCLALHCAKVPEENINRPLQYERALL